MYLFPGATIGFTEEDYRGREESTTIRLVVSKQGQNTNEIVVSVIPMTFGQFEASGKNLPLDFQPTDLPDPAECEKQWKWFQFGSSKAWQ